MFITVTLAPALDKSVLLPGFVPGAVNRIRSVRAEAGGKGINVSLIMQKLGSPTVLTGLLGGGTGRRIASLLGSTGLDCRFVETAAETRTNLKIQDPANGATTDINEPAPPVDDETLERVFRTITSCAKAGDTVLMAGSLPAGTPVTIYRAWVEQLHALGIRSIVDADAPMLTEAVKAHPMLIKPNEDEFCRLTGRTYHAPEDMIPAARALGIDTVILSMGGKGALFIRQDQALFGEALEVPVVCTTGAGDSMLGGFCHGLVQRLPFRDCCAMALAAGNAAVTLPGTETPEKALVERCLKDVRIREIGRR